MLTIREFPTDVSQDYYLCPTIEDLSGFLPNRYYLSEAGKYLKTYYPIKAIFSELGIIAEDLQGEIIIVGIGQKQFEGWEEISKEEFEKKLQRKPLADCSG